MTRLMLPTPDGSLAPFEPSGKAIAATRRDAPTSRRILAAAHVVTDPRATVNPGEDAVIDWQATLAFRRHLQQLGLGIAEAMDTAQRGMGLAWPQALELVKRTCAELGDQPATPVFAGAGTDQLAVGEARDLDQVGAAYVEQVEAIQGAGARVILMASSEMARVASKPEDYAAVYGRALAACEQPVILHWLGEMFAPALAGYWGASDLDVATESCLEIIEQNAAKIAGVKLSLLDKDREIALRRRLPAEVLMYTGDDFNYPELIAGDEQGHSDALLGILDPIAPVAAVALAKLDQGDDAGFRALLDPTVPLARLMFGAPTYHYKVGVVFLAWLNGHQDHFCMLGAAQGMRSICHLAELFRLADACGLLVDGELASARMATLLALHGIAASG